MSADMLLTLNAGSSTAKIALFEGRSVGRARSGQGNDRFPQESTELPRHRGHCDFRREPQDRRIRYSGCHRGNLYQAR